MCQWPLTGITPNSVKSVRSAGRPTAITSRPSSGDGDSGQHRSSSPRLTPRPACEGATHSSAISSIPGNRETIA